MLRPLQAACLATALCSLPRLAAARSPASQPTSQPTSQPASSSKPPRYSTTVHGHSEHHGEGRASGKVTRREIEERLPRSAPDVLRYEPGVYIQQTAHGQASAYIRGRTGQQTVLLFDGIRLNNSTFRQGPNQYFFTIDARTIQSVTVVRGGASTRYGSDAIGGAIAARPISPVLDPRQTVALRVAPQLMLRTASADGEIGGRAQLSAQLGSAVALLGGVGYRRLGQLEGGGVLRSPSTGEPARVARLADDGRTQLGTGFRELTSDVRLVAALGRHLSLTAALYDYRQLDAPRTDKCPPYLAPISACLRYDEQFRTLAYARLVGHLPFAAAQRVSLTAGYQNQHERRTNSRPASFVENGGRDDVHTLMILARLASAPLHPLRWLALSFDYGLDVYHDRITSVAWTSFSDIDVVVPSSRGQYLDGSTYTWGGLYARGAATLWQQLTVRAGVRATATFARAPADSESGSRAVDSGWITAVGHVGLEWRALPWLSVLASLDRSFRAPNLNDMTSRQQTGPGFQFENPELRPETATTLEGGVRLRAGRLRAELWGYRAMLGDAIERAPRRVSQCPPNTPQCATSTTRYQLVNLDDLATIHGFEAVLRLRLPWRLGARATLAYAIGSGPNPSDAPSPSTVPLSRVPPLNGTVELRWRHDSGIYLGAALRWALQQDRLSLGDEADVRIPTGGTPGFAVFDLRAGYRFGRRLLVSLVVENIGDAAYRYHGSSVNGPGAQVILGVELRPFAR